MIDHETLIYKKYLPKLYSLWMNIIENETGDDHHGKYITLEQLPYSYSKSHDALTVFIKKLEEVKTIYIKSEEEFGYTKGSMSSFGLDDYHIYNLSYEIDNFLDSSRKCQNSIISYIQQYYKTSLPSSLNSLYKKINTGKVSISPIIDQNICKYWEQSGLMLKNYRDISQHHAVVSSDARFVTYPDGKYGIFLVLINNHEQKIAKKMSFGSPYVHALDYMIKSFISLTIFLKNISTYLYLNYNVKERNSDHVFFKDPLKFHKGGHPSSKIIDRKELSHILNNNLMK